MCTDDGYIPLTSLLFSLFSTFLLSGTIFFLQEKTVSYTKAHTQNVLTESSIVVFSFGSNTVVTILSIVAYMYVAT